MRISRKQYEDLRALQKEICLVLSDHCILPRITFNPDNPRRYSSTESILHSLYTVEKSTLKAIENAKEFVGKYPFLVEGFAENAYKDEDGKAYTYEALCGFSKPGNISSECEKIREQDAESISNMTPEEQFMVESDIELMVCRRYLSGAEKLYACFLYNAQKALME